MRNRRHFFRHYVEMIIAMFAGMAVLDAATQGLLALAGLESPMARHVELANLKMAFDMSVGMVVWMRYRGHGWASSLEMTGAMFAPAIALIPLLWLGVVTAGSMYLIEHLAMFPLMLALMLRRREEYGWSSARTAADPRTDVLREGVR